VASRARIAAASCLVTAGLLGGGGATATAVAETGAGSGIGDTVARDPAKTPRAPRTSGDTDSGAEKPSDPHDVGEPPRDRDDDPVTGEVKVRSGRGAAGDDGNGAGDGSERPPCCEGGRGDCREHPVDPGDAPTSSGDYGEHRPETVPPGRPMPPLGGGGIADVLDVVPGIGANDSGHAPITVPIIVARPAGVAPAASPPPGVGPATGGAGVGLPVAPRQGTASSPSPSPSSSPSHGRPLPAPAGGSAATPASAHRAGYSPQLRGAGTRQLAALALPGLAGMLILTGVGGLVGYRQAKAGQHLRPSGITRFMN
jgi:hypothetical protein